MKTQLPWINRAKGSAGGMTACKVYDKNVFRAKPYEVNNPKTQKQTTQRDFFKEVSALVATFTDEQLRTLYPNAPKGMSRRNALTKQLSEYFSVSGTTKSVDYANIDTLGNAKTMDFGEISLSVVDTSFVISINPNAITDQSLYDYKICLILIEETTGKIAFVTTDNAVDDYNYGAPVPAGWDTDNEIHGFPLITDSKVQLQEFGSFHIMRRPEKVGR